ncbi:MAG: hypothetical protein Q8K58_14325 [Acidimicrobiales bacterium]|nr:hypothetical protein [Acidimicrobiales bacterium]
MSARPPKDAAVALRSLDRRFRGLFAGLGEDESPDDLAHRVGPDGMAALDHVAGAIRTTSLLRRALEQVLTEDDAVLHPAVADATHRQWESDPTATVDDLVAELASEAELLAVRVEGVQADDWARRARVVGQDADVTALALVWDAVDAAVSHLKGAERTLVAMRGRG